MCCDSNLHKSLQSAFNFWQGRKKKLFKICKRCSINYPIWGQTFRLQGGCGRCVYGIWFWWVRGLNSCSHLPMMAASQAAFTWLLMHSGFRRLKPAKNKFTWCHLTCSKFTQFPFLVIANVSHQKFVKLLAGISIIGPFHKSIFWACFSLLGPIVWRRGAGNFCLVGF